MSLKQIKRRAREVAFETLYEMDVRHCFDLSKKTIEAHFDHFRIKKESRPFAEFLVTGTCKELEQIDQKIANAGSTWKLDRMSYVDRNLIRLATFELFFGNETPKNIIIDEAIELAKQFGDDRSPSFVNGVLDAIAKSSSL